MAGRSGQVGVALDTLARALAKVAENVDLPPYVDFDVSWVEVTVMGQEHKSYQPVIHLSVTKHETVNLSDVLPDVPEGER